MCFNIYTLYLLMALHIRGQELLLITAEFRSLAFYYIIRVREQTANYPNNWVFAVQKLFIESKMEKRDICCLLKCYSQCRQH